YNCNITCDEFEQKQEDGASLRLGGLVISADEKYSKNGKPYGIITIEDFNGKAQLKLFGRQFEQYFSRFIPGDAVIVQLQCQASRFNPSFLDIQIIEVSDLNQLKGKVANAIMVTLSSEMDNPEFFKALGSFESDDTTKRLGHLYIRLFDMERKQYITMHSRKRYVLDKDFVDMIESWNVHFRIDTVNT
ncbi:MAG: hypothetical protein K2M03_04920, partial [Muribaculaceae bacterium]|nr:hypothetical protein [Muribaculaceae bacterium]